MSEHKIPKLVEIADGLCVQPKSVAAIKRGTLADEDESCTVLLRGQSALEGLVVEKSYEDVMDEINDAIARFNEDREDEVDDEDDEEVSAKGGK